MIATIVKIDICKSKTFASKMERYNPLIRTEALNKLLAVSRDCFPEGSQSYPEGSFYKADGDAVYYIVEKPSVGLRGAIEFMQSWYHQGLSEYPECRALLDRGFVDIIAVPGKTELTGKPFENISMFEKEAGEGRVYLTKEVLDNVDQTMAKFIFYDWIKPRTGETLSIYYVDFLDPRTVADSSLIHALFIAHPMATEARERLFELFAVEYLLEHESLKEVNEFKDWAKKNNYSLPTSRQILDLLEGSSLIGKNPAGAFCLHSHARDEVVLARKEFILAKSSCLEELSKSIRTVTGRDGALEGVSLDVMAEEYLCAVFSEIRLMANYFRSTLHLFNTGPEQFVRFDYIIRRHLSEKHLSYFQDFRRGFITGLKKTCEKENLYISAVFHNVLATYYLNRSAQVSPYQLEKLQKRQVILDTNVLYSLMVPSSQFHEITSYFVQRLAKMNIKIRVSAITLNEYEEALAFVEKHWDESGPDEYLITRNPWLYQEYMRNPGRFLNSIAVCRQEYSLTKGLSVTDDNIDQIQKKLNMHGIALETDWKELPSSEVEDLWIELRNDMTSSAWDINRYWEFIHKDFPPSVKLHDMTCIANLSRKANVTKTDALGPRVLFITVDSKMYHLRRRFPFIVTPEQFLEFILPYLFLSDIPIVDAEKFPNILLSAQLGTLLVRRPPKLAEIVAAYFRSPELAQSDAAQVFSSLSEDSAEVLNNERFRNLVRESEGIPDAQRNDVIEKTTDALEELLDEKRQIEKDRKKVEELHHQISEQEQKQRNHVSELERKIEKLQKTVKYWRAQAKKR